MRTWHWMLAAVVVACSAEDQPGPVWSPNGGSSSGDTSSNASTSGTTSGQGGQGGAGENVGGGSAAAPCTDSCLNGTPGGAECEECVVNQCGAELSACTADPGGEGCISCAEVLNGGDPALICGESQLILEKLRGCVCGGDNVPGACA